MQDKIETKEDASKVLHALSERSAKNIEKSINIHLEIDPPNNRITDNDGDRLYRLRKVLFHALMIRDLGGYNDLLHAIAVECRAAQEQLDMLLKKDLRRSPLLDLSPYIHPTPILLICPQSTGGLASDHDIRIHAKRLMMLSSFGIGYASALLHIANDFNKNLCPKIADIVFDYSKIGDNLPSAKKLHVLLKDKLE